MTKKKHRAEHQEEQQEEEAGNQYKDACEQAFRTTQDRKTRIMLAEVLGLDPVSGSPLNEGQDSGVGTGVGEGEGSSREE